MGKRIQGKGVLMNILITGGAGFIGKHLEKELSQHHNVEIIEIKNG